MKRPLLMAGLAMLLYTKPLSSQINLNWLTSFIPAWLNGNTNGTALNIGGYSINCNTTVTMIGSGAFMPTMGSFGSQSPSVAGAVFTVPGSSNRIQVTPNYGSNTSYTNIVMSYSSLTTNVVFRIVDIDKSDATSTTYFDKVTVTGTDGTTTYYPTITKYDNSDPNFLVISGNSARVSTVSGQAGNTNSDATDQRGTVTVNFGSAVINSVTVRYDNAPGCDANPASQSIAIGSISFNQSTLPVTLARFSGYRQSSDILLDWTTQQEFNSASFDIERSTSMGSWEKIGSVPAAGNSTTAVDYHFRDLNPQGTLLLYRLKQIDIDNHYKYSSVVRINAANAGTDMQLYPNPASDRVNISIRSAGPQPATFRILDALGRVMRTESRKLYPGENNFILSDFTTLPNGLYHIVAYDKNGALMGRTKFIKE